MGVAQRDGTCWASARLAMCILRILRNTKVENPPHSVTARLRAVAKAEERGGRRADYR